MKATCECCGRGQRLTSEQEKERIGADGSFVCDKCLTEGKPAKVKRVRQPQVDPNRRMGCIATVRYPDGRTESLYRDGKTSEALREIADSLPDGAAIICISTWRTILSDLRDPPRRRNSERNPVDPFAVERVLLGRIGRMDLLPREADQLFSHHPSKRRKVA